MRKRDLLKRIEQLEQRLAVAEAEIASLKWNPWAQPCYPSTVTLIPATAGELTVTGKQGSEILNIPATSGVHVYSTAGKG